MNYFCSDCKYYDIDYEWDDLAEDEVEIVTCQKGHEIPCDDTTCSDFKKYRLKPYKEEFSECDGCKYLSSCSNTIESTTRLDTCRHFIKGMGYCQKKDGAINEKKLSEIIQLSENSDLVSDTTILILNKAIEKFGDITYGEFTKDKVWEVFKKGDDSC